MRIRTVSLASSAAAAFLLFGCLGVNDPSDSDTTDPTTSNPTGKVKLMSQTYTLSGNQLITPYQDIYCNDSELVTETGADTMLYEVTATTLKLYDSTDTMILSRIGTGSGLVGSWKFTEPPSSDDTSGTDPSELIFLDPATTVEISSNQINIYATPAALSPLLSMFTGFMSMVPTITVDSTSKPGSVLLTNTQTNEVVTLSFTSQGKLRFTSSNPAHATYEMSLFEQTVPTSCPDEGSDFGPAWMNEFVGMQGFTKKIALAKIKL